MYILCSKLILEIIHSLVLYGSIFRNGKSLHSSHNRILIFSIFLYININLFSSDISTCFSIGLRSKERARYFIKRGFSNSCSFRYSLVFPNECVMGSYP